MSDASVNRKLAAILSADVVGYSRLMADDEVATVETLKRYRAEIGRIIEHHKGRIVNAPGDNILAEFASAVEAVRAAVEIQRSIQEKNADLAEERRMRFRVGVNLGDIIEEADGTIYGDGVNIAARLEALCEPGGICVSGTIFDQVEGKVQASFEFAGEQKVKNIEKPIRTYHLQRTPSRTWFWLRAKRKSRLVAAGLAAALLVSVVIWQAKNLDEPVDNADETLLEMPTGPVIAVLPFDNMSDDPAQDYFSDGLTEDIITELARFREIHVLARNTTFQYKGQSVDVPAVARELGADYVLEGSVRKANDRVRITAQLIDASTGAHLWAERFDRNYDDIFEIQDEVTQKIIGTVASGYGSLIQEAEIRKANRKKPDQLEAYEAVLRTRSAMYSQEWYEKSRASLERAIALDPNYARARSEYAWIRLMGWIFRLDPAPVPPTEILENAVTAVQLDPNNAYAHRTAAYGYFYRKQMESFEQAALTAMKLSPYDAEIYAELGMLFAFSGQWDRGLALVNKAFAINPVSAAGWGHSALHYNHYRERRYQEALTVMMAHPGMALCENQAKLVATYGQLGQPEKAKPYWERCQATVPDMSADWFASTMRLWNFQEPFITHYMEGFEKAGYPCRSKPCGMTGSEQASYSQD